MGSINQTKEKRERGKRRRRKGQRVIIHTVQIMSRMHQMVARSIVERNTGKRVIIHPKIEDIREAMIVQMTIINRVIPRGGKADIQIVRTVLMTTGGIEKAPTVMMIIVSPAARSEDTGLPVTPLTLTGMIDPLGGSVATIVIATVMKIEAEVKGPGIAEVCQGLQEGTDVATQGQEADHLK